MDAVWTVEDFKRALAEMRLAEAADWLETVLSRRADFPQWTNKVFDNREFALFTVCCNYGYATKQLVWYQLAKRVIENSRNMSRIPARRQHLAKLSGIVYELI